MPAIKALVWLRPSEWQKTLVFAAVIGVLGALATLGFRSTLFFIQYLLFDSHTGLVNIAKGLLWWQRLLSPAVGGLVAGLFLVWARRLAGGQTSSDYMEAVALGGGDLPVRVSLIRALSSIATVATGGAIGREGPMVQLAALAGSLIGRWRKSPIPRRRLMVACGAAAGVATAYSAPIAGALFVAEIVLQSIAIESLGPLLVASVTANLTMVQITGIAPVYQMPPFTLPHSGVILSLAGLGVLGGLVTPMYLWVLDQSKWLFKQWHVPIYLKMCLGGLFVGALSLAHPEVWGNGFSVVNSILQGGWVWQALLVALIFKVLAVGMTTGSGAIGGIFTPTLFVGAAVGAIFGLGIQYVLPHFLPEPASVAVGMGVVLAAATHAPLMSVLMIFEMTENYDLIVPLMLACVLSNFISRSLRAQSIYAVAHAMKQIPQLAMAVDFLRTQCATVQVNQTLSELEEAFMHYRWPHLYVLDAENKFLGAISLHDISALFHQPQTNDDWPRSLIKANYPRVTNTTPAWQVLEIFATHSGERLPVLDEKGRLSGYVTKTDLVLMFRERLSTI